MKGCDEVTSSREGRCLQLCKNSEFLKIAKTVKCVNFFGEKSNGPLVSITYSKKQKTTYYVLILNIIICSVV